MYSMLLFRYANTGNIWEKLTVEEHFDKLTDVDDCDKLTARDRHDEKITTESNYELTKRNGHDQ